jgi:hypothetical protein
MKSIVHVVLWGALLMLGLTACSMQMGKEFSGPRASEVLRPQETSMEAVERALGAPMGRGQGYLPGAGPIDVWEYHYATATAGGDAQQKMLFVFFDHRRLVQGYLWYSTFE